MLINPEFWFDFYFRTEGQGDLLPCREDWYETIHAKDHYIMVKPGPRAPNTHVHPYEKTERRLRVSGERYTPTPLVKTGLRAAGYDPSEDAKAGKDWMDGARGNDAGRNTGQNFRERQMAECGLDVPTGVLAKGEREPFKFWDAPGVEFGQRDKYIAIYFRVCGCEPPRIPSAIGLDEFLPGRFPECEIECCCALVVVRLQGNENPFRSTVTNQIGILGPKCGSREDCVNNMEVHELDLFERVAKGDMVQGRKRGPGFLPQFNVRPRTPAVGERICAPEGWFRKITNFFSDPHWGRFFGEPEREFWEKWNLGL